MLTTPQNTALKAHIQADATLLSLWQAGDPWSVAAAMNTPAAPDFWVWKSRVGKDEIMQNGFDWVQVDNLSVGKARIWDWLFDNPQRSFNPSKDNVRAGISECWKGTAAMLSVRDAVLGHCRRGATRAEKLFATGTGSTVSPAVMSFEGSLLAQDVASAMEG